MCRATVGSTDTECGARAPRARCNERRAIGRGVVKRVPMRSHIFRAGAVFGASLGLLAPAVIAGRATTQANATAAAATTSERLQALAKTITFDWAKSHPLFATGLGLSDEDGELDTPSAAENAHDLATIRRWESELAAIPLKGASLTDVDD